MRGRMGGALDMSTTTNSSIDATSQTTSGLSAYEISLFERVKEHYGDTIPMWIPLKDLSAIANKANMDLAEAQQIWFKCVSQFECQA